MRKLAVLLGFVWCVGACASARADTLPLFDTLHAQFLFIDGDRAYLRTTDAVGPRDSLWVPGLGTVLEADPPILKLAVSAYFVRLQMGDSVNLLRAVLRRRAADLFLACDPSAWDPLTIRSGSAFAVAGLFQRGLFRLSDDRGNVRGDLARDWSWKGFDLFVVIDTSARFGDGTPIDAHAVKASLERYFWYERDVPEFSWQYAIAGLRAYRSGRTDHVLGIIPRSLDTLQFNMERPLYDLPGYLATPALSIIRWRRESDAAPVVATAGPYGRRTADTLFGSPPSYGRITLRAGEDSSVVPRDVRLSTEQGDQGAGQVERSVGRIASPALLVVRPTTDLGRQLLPFVRFAVDRRAVMAAAGEVAARGATSLFPQVEVDTAGRGGSGYPDFEKAREARRLVRGAPRVRIGGVGSERAVSVYLVDALKAWDLKAVLADSGAACDLQVERWLFDGFLPCAWAENALSHLRRPAGDTLVTLLQRARQTASDGDRAQAYRSLLVRIADDEPYLALLQLGTRIDRPSDLDFRADQLGRPVGPIFAPTEDER